MPKGFHELEAVVEIPKGSHNKYRFDEEKNAIKLSRVLYSPVHYPCDYGFLPGFTGGDGDPLDVLIMAEEPTFPGCHVTVRPIGYLSMKDQKGPDEKILAVSIMDPFYGEIHRLRDIYPHSLKEIQNFFEIYKELETGKKVDVNDWHGAAHAQALLQRSKDKKRISLFPKNSVYLPRRARSLFASPPLRE